jgi:hypothetical protein
VIWLWIALYLGTVLGGPMLIGVAVGTFIGRRIGRRRVAQWLTLGVIAAGGIGAALGARVVIPGIPSTGGTEPHHMLPYDIVDALTELSLGLMFLTPLVLGFVIGSVKSFRPEDRGWLRFGHCVTACVLSISVGVFLAWIVAL